jgi:hypothetical protein
MITQIPHTPLDGGGPPRWEALQVLQVKKVVGAPVVDATALQSRRVPRRNKSLQSNVVRQMP